MKYHAPNHLTPPSAPVPITEPDTAETAKVKLKELNNDWRNLGFRSEKIATEVKIIFTKSSTNDQLSVD